MQAANEALAGMRAPEPGPGSAIAAASGHFRVRLVVSDGPEGTVSPVLAVDDGVVSMTSDLPNRTDPSSPVDVTIVLAWDDALSMFDGHFSAAQAISEGRVRVRGDLGVLVAGQSVIAAASPALAPLRARTEH